MNKRRRSPGPTVWTVETGGVRVYRTWRYRVRRSASTQRSCVDLSSQACAGVNAAPKLRDAVCQTEPHRETEFKSRPVCATCETLCVMCLANERSVAAASSVAASRGPVNGSATGVARAGAGAAGKKVKQPTLRKPASDENHDEVVSATQTSTEIEAKAQSESFMFNFPDTQPPSSLSLREGTQTKKPKNSVTPGEAGEPLTRIEFSGKGKTSKRKTAKMQEKKNTPSSPVRSDAEVLERTASDGDIMGSEIASITANVESLALEEVELVQAEPALSKRSGKGRKKREPVQLESRKVQAPVKQSDEQRKVQNEITNTAASKIETTLAKVMKSRYRAYWSITEVDDHVAQKKLVTGPIRIFGRVGFVTDAESGRDIRLNGWQAMNRAFDGDVVAVLICSSADAPQSGPEVDEDDLDEDLAESLEQVHTESNGSFDAGDTLQVRSLDKVPRARLSGKVVRILRAVGRRLAIGSLRSRQNDDKKLQEDDSILFYPIEASMPIGVVPIRSLPKQLRQALQKSGLAVLSSRLFACVYTNWRETSLHPIARFMDDMGQAGDIRTETRAILLRNQIVAQPYDESKYAADLPTSEAEWHIPEDEISRRRDLRGIRIFSIDPKTARDLDDALSIARLPSGLFEVGIHIADVSYFVKPNSQLDKDAALRSTSVYLVHTVIPMLPRVLCQELCSLNPAKDRLCFSVLLQMDAEGRIQSSWFGRTVIRSCVKLAYEEAQDLIDGKVDLEWAAGVSIDAPHTLSAISEDVRALNEIARHMRRRRFEDGSVSLHSTELNFAVDRQTGLPTGFKTYVRRESNELVEEFMLCANRAVATFISKALSKYAILRRHEPPKLDLLDEFHEWCREYLQIGVDLDSSLHVQQSLAMLECTLAERDMAHVFQIAQLLLTKPMQNARYFCTGDLNNPALWGHYALAFDRYTHFTSPIRRYPDLIVHRLLQIAIEMHGPTGHVDPAKAAGFNLDLKKVKGIVANGNVSATAAECTMKSLSAKKAEEECKEVFLGILLDITPRIMVGIVMGIQKQAFTLFVPALGRQKTLREEDLKKFGVSCTTSLNKSSSQKSVELALRERNAAVCTWDIRSTDAKRMREELQQRVETVEIGRGRESDDGISASIPSGTSNAARLYVVCCKEEEIQDVSACDPPVVDARSTFVLQMFQKVLVLGSGQRTPHVAVNIALLLNTGVLGFP
ncbi:DIS3-like exonuclease 2 [Porphyridium purpureum]|uniref:DIS3-like exonuclease 2 n=1 Tax=Porphyridium purpureum TaxID=35688 RepID=A0A5J4Z6N8_PORPP|nr:DIS3-like exonuclease 2 [Porphyridium purpureum]|eukprot:POR9316..scf295_1